MILYWATLAVALAIVLVLSGYLIAIAWALFQAKRNVARLADGLEAIAAQVAPAGEKIVTIDGALGQLVEDITAVDRHLGGAATAFR